MRFAVGAPNVAAFADPRFLVGLARTAELAGWDGFFVWDHLVYRPPAPAAVDPWSVVAAAAVVTSRIRLGVLVAALPRRRPAIVAQQVATIDRLSGGRLILGAGLGSIAEEYSAFGENDDPAVRGRRLDEALDVICGLWSGAPLNHRGEFYEATNATILPPPLQQPRPPIWIAGRWPNRAPFRRAARYEGVMPTHVDYAHGSFMTPGELEAVVAYIRQHRERPEPFDVVMEGESDGPGLRALAQQYEEAGLTWWVEKLGWWRGDGEAARRRAQLGPPTEAP